MNLKKGGGDAAPYKGCFDGTLQGTLMETVPYTSPYIKGLSKQPEIGPRKVLLCLHLPSPRPEGHGSKPPKAGPFLFWPGVWEVRDI